MRSVQAALGELLRGGPDTAPGVPATMVPTPYDADALATHLAGDAESPVAEEDPETAEAMADPAAAAEAEEDAEAAAAAEAEETAAVEAAEAGGDVGSHSGRAFSDSLANGHFDQPMPSAHPSVPADGYESDVRSVDEVPESDHESGGGGGWRRCWAEGGVPFPPWRFVH
jgi:phage-related tail fiber protein